MRMRVALFLMMVMALVLPGGTALGQLCYTPHENPRHAESSIATPAYLLFYANTIGLLVSKDYQDADDLLRQFENADLPLEADLLSITTQFNELIVELSANLQEIGDAIEQARFAIEQKQLEEAGVILDRASTLIEGTRDLIIDIEDATETLLQRLGSFVQQLLNESLEYAYGRLQIMIEKLKELEQDYAHILALWEVAVSADEEQLVATKITLTLETEEAVVGQTIGVSGILTSEGMHIPGRQVTITIDGAMTGTDVTGIDGSYRTEILVPYEYVSEASIQAQYTPFDNDIITYEGCRSTEVTLRVLFYETEVKFTAPEEAYPGRLFAIAGQITSGTTDSPTRVVKAMLDDELLAEEPTNNGRFTLIVSPSHEIANGVHTLAVVVEPEGCYEGVSEERSLTIVRISPEIHLSAPAITTSSGTIRLNGTVLSEKLGGVSGAQVTATLEGTSIATETLTGADGRFSLALNMPLYLSEAGIQQKLNVRVSSSDPWISPAQTSHRLFIANPIILGLVGTVVASTGVVLYRGRARTKVGQASSWDKTILAALDTELEAMIIEDKGIAGIYMRTLRAIELSTGVVMKHSMTMREFLHDVTLILGQSARDFEELTSMAERAAYSPYVPTHEDLARSAFLAHAVENEIGVGI